MRQREQAAALEAALEHSSSEVRGLLASLDLAAGTGGRAGGDGGAQLGGAEAATTAAEAAVLAVRGALGEAHERVQGAAQRLRQTAGEVEALKRRHVAMRQQVGARLAARLPCCRRAASAAA